MSAQTGRTGSACSAWPVTGESQSTNPLPIARSPPSATDPTARTTMGIVMSAGDSCGCCTGPSVERLPVGLPDPSFQRLCPWNVMKNRRDM
ncbi:hypothetical protein D3C74_289550 [compost metagenome]